MGAAQLFTSAAIDGVRVYEALIDTGSTFSMISNSFYSRLPSKPTIHKFDSSAPELVGVGGASATVPGYIDVPLTLAGVKIAHPLFVVEGLAFSLLVGMDVLRPHVAQIRLFETSPVKFNARVCDICLEQSTDTKREFCSQATVAYTVEPAKIPANSAAIILVRVSKSTNEASTVVIEPLESSTANIGCAAMPAVCAQLKGETRIAIVNPSLKLIELLADYPIASAKPVTSSPLDTRIVAIVPRLSRDAKLRKVIFELQIDVIPDSYSQKKKLLALLSKFLDVFSGNESDVGTTDLAFFEIETGDVRPLRQPVRRIPYG